jgi:hypothetical protein
LGKWDAFANKYLNVKTNLFSLTYREYYPQNIMYDKRVFRGSTNAAMVLPAGNYPDQLFDNRKERAKAKA